MPARSEKQENRRVEVARACFRVIASRGISGTTLQEIAEEMGCSIGVLAYYFRNKADLLRFTKNLLFDEINKNMLAAAEKTAGVSRLYAMFEEALPLDDEGLIMWQIYLAFLSQTVGDPSLMKVQAERNAYSISILEKAIGDLQRSGDITTEISAKDEAMSSIAFLEGLGFHAAIDPNRFTPKLIRRLVSDHVRRVFGPMA